MNKETLLLKLKQTTGGNVNADATKAVPAQRKKSSAARAFIRENNHCGDCSRLEREKLDGEFCSNVGRLPESRACQKFVPDAFSLVSDELELDALQGLAEQLRDLSPRSLRVLAGLLVRESVTRRQNFRFMQRVYVHFQGTLGDDYLSNFCVANVIDATKDRIRLVGASNRVIITLAQPTFSILTTAEFAALRAKLVAENRIIDPSIKRFAKQFDLKRQNIDIDDLVDSKYLDEALAIEEVSRSRGARTNRNAQPNLMRFANAVESGSIAPTDRALRRIDWRSGSNS